MLLFLILKNIINLQKRDFKTTLLGFSSYRLSQAAGLFRIVEDFIVEDREVEGQTEPNGVCWLHLPFANVKRLLVRLLGMFHCIFRERERQGKITITSYIYTAMQYVLRPLGGSVKKAKLAYCCLEH